MDNRPTDQVNCMLCAPSKWLSGEIINSLFEIQINSHFILHMQRNVLIFHLNLKINEKISEKILIKIIMNKDDNMHKSEALKRWDKRT